jgi:branched-chain amino acid transport system ATP-binding protein
MSAVILETQGLSNHFGSVCTAKDLHLAFEEGVLASVIGPNGAGKSTLINLLTGHLPVQQGRILFRGREVTRLSVHERVRMGICRSFQIANVFPRLTVLENVLIPVLSMGGRTRRLFARVSGEAAARREALAVLDRVGLSGERDVPASALSHGDKRLLEVGVALAARPSLLFLDEPTAGMNPVERSRLLENVRAVVVLHRGEILCDGAPDKVRNDPRVKEVYLGDEVSDLHREAGAEAAR